MADRLRAPLAALTLGAIGAAVLMLCAPFWPTAVLVGWLPAAVALAWLPATALLLLMMMRVIPGAWGDELELLCEAAVLLLPLGALAFLPVLIGQGAIYPWPGSSGRSAFAEHWLQPGWFVLRTLLWFALLGLLGWSMLARVRRVAVAAGGLMLLVLGASMVNADWLMSLDPRLSSSGFGLQTMAVETTAGLAVLLIARLMLRPPAGPLSVLGGLLLTFLLIFAYLSFLPFFILWSGDLPDGVQWYTVRGVAPWPALNWISSLIVAGCTWCLLFPLPRRSSGWLFLLSALTLGAMLIQLIWYALPPHGGRVLLFAGLSMGVAGLLVAGALPIAIRRRLSARAPQEALA